MNDLSALIREAISAMRDTADELKERMMPMDFTTPTIERLRSVSTALSDALYAWQSVTQRTTSDDLAERVTKFNRLDLPGQPLSMHMGTSYLINDLWQEIKRLRTENEGYPGIAHDFEQARADAERFRWLADKCSVTYCYKRPDGSNALVAGPLNLASSVDASRCE